MPRYGGLIELYLQGIQLSNYFGSWARDPGLEDMLYYVSDSTLEVDIHEKQHRFIKALCRNDVCPIPDDLFSGGDRRSSYGCRDAVVGRKL
jgi:hypothetical protein